MKCPRCDMLKPVSAFARAQHRKTGYQLWCKSCAADYRKDNLEHIKAWGVKFRSKHKDRLAQEHKAYRVDNPDKIQARWQKYSRTPDARFLRSRIEAARRKIKWDLSRDYYRSLVIQVCVYCSGSLSEVGVGLDRRDSSAGYVIDNVVPCCTQCNVAKSDYFTFKETIEEIGPAIRRIRLKRQSISVGRKV